MLSLSRSPSFSYFSRHSRTTVDVRPRCRLFSSARITWQILTADGDSDGRGIYDGCQPIRPLALNPGAYDVQIDAQSTDADYQFTARSS